VYTLVDLFAGCGGGSMGFHRAGFATVTAIEIDEDAAEAFALNVGVKPMVKDIRKVSLQDMRDAGVVPGELTLLFGCPPCQSFTILRRGADESDEDHRRNSLVFEYLRLVKDLRPRHIAFENVPGLVEGRWREYFDILQAELQTLGYDLDYDVLDAAEYGVPQRRKRVLVIGSRVTAPELPEPTHGEGRKPFVTVRDTIERLPRLAAGESDPDDEFHRARRHSALAVRRLAHVPEGGGRADLPDHLVLDCHRNHNGHYDIYGRMWWDQVAPTLTSGCTNVTRGRFAHPRQNRAITLREAMLLQTFPSHAVLRGGVEAMALQVGNAVPSLLAECIGKQIAVMEERSLRGDGQTEGGAGPT
jgi:DNA (cytosine-5)-methyltransferase 1